MQTQHGEAAGLVPAVLHDYGPEPTVVVHGDEGPRTRPIADLLPDAPWFDGWTG